jgi:ATP-dependent helicase/nuclease subunit A
LLEQDRQGTDDRRRPWGGAVSGAPVPRDHAARDRAASDFATNLVVSAGAGTGKTTLLVERILTAIGSGRAALPAIAAITFTDKAAGELRHRLASGLRSLGELARGASPGTEASAAKSAFSRLTASSRVDLAAVVARVDQAEASLDRAAVTTIHGLCSEILRAHPLASGLPPGFVADRGLAGRRLASLEWASFVEEELGPSGRRAELWERVLGSLSLADLEDIGRVLAGGAISEAALAADHRAVDLRAVLGEDALRLAESTRTAIEATPGLTDAPRQWLDQVERALRVFAAQGSAATRVAIEGASRLPGPMPGVRTKNVADSDALRLESIEDSVRPFVRSLAVFDERVEADLFAALLPFARRLRASQTRSGLVDFDGLLVRARDLLRDHPDVRAALKRRFTMILVDEFQDTDPIQYEIAFFLAEQAGTLATDAYATKLAPGSLFIVGDAKQSIYRFRGADFAAYRRAVGHVLGQGGVELSLTSNFRSMPAVLRAVNALFGATSPPLWVASDYLPRYEPVEAERRDDGVAAVEIWTTSMGPAAPAPVRRRAEGIALAAEIAAMAGRGSAFRYDDVLVLFRGFTDLPPYLRALRAAAIPFVVSGGRTFFERTEIVQAMAVLRAVADPGDPVALLAYRRSPAGGVPDTELAAHAAGGARPLPALEASDSRLAALRLEVERLPVDAAVRHVLDASGLVALSGLAFEASQRVANLEKLQLAASELSRDGHRTMLETLDALEEGFEFDEEGDSPLADADHDAVRVMSIHKAKGLEARVVVLADTAASRSNRGARHFTGRMTRVGPDEFVRLDGPTFRNAAAIAASLDDARHVEAEDVRLLYVALTRARDRLVVFGGGARTAWSAALAAWTEGVTPRTVADSVTARRIDLRPVVGAPDALERFDEAAALTRTAASFRSPSDLGEAGMPARAVPGASEPALARAVGRIVHARLAGIKTPDGGLGYAEAESVLRLFEGSPLAARLATIDVLGREVPLLLGEDGLLWHGSIDLLYRDRDGTIVVADFKTDASDDGAIARHGGQLGVYARAVRRALPHVRVRAELWMLRTGRVLEV